MGAENHLVRPCGRGTFCALNQLLRFDPITSLVAVMKAILSRIYRPVLVTAFPDWSRTVVVSISLWWAAIHPLSMTFESAICAAAFTIYNERSH